MNLCLSARHREVCEKLMHSKHERLAQSRCAHNERRPAFVFSLRFVFLELKTLVRFEFEIVRWAGFQYVQCL